MSTVLNEVGAVFEEFVLNWKKNLSLGESNIRSYMVIRRCGNSCFCIQFLGEYKLSVVAGVVRLSWRPSCPLKSQNFSPNKNPQTC